MPEGGSVLFITSIAAFFPDDRSSLIMAMYGVSKTALLGVVKALSFELGLSGVRVNGLAAGVIPTGFSSILTGEKNRHLVVCDCTCQHVFQSQMCVGLAPAVAWCAQQIQQRWVIEGRVPQVGRVCSFLWRVCIRSFRAALRLVTPVHKHPVVQFLGGHGTCTTRFGSFNRALPADAVHFTAACRRSVLLSNGLAQSTRSLALQRFCALVTPAMSLVKRWLLAAASPHVHKLWRLAALP
jgi:Enoyl-(Acyl carrier protein) reductase